jgi:hypothetical protein
MLSARGAGSAGALGLFDPLSSQNPASIASLEAFTASFNVLQEYRTSENPAGSASVRDTRFPQVLIGGPLKTLPLTLGVSYSNYSNRDFSLASRDSVLLRGNRVGVTDTLTSRGGLSTIRGAIVWRASGRTAIGGGINVITGSDRVQQRRVFGDTTFRPVRDSSELSYATVGFSVGVIQQMTSRLTIGLSARRDGAVKIDRDSTRVGQLQLPWIFAGGLRYQVAPTLGLGAEARYSTWADANAGQAAGTTPASNTVDLSFGGEFASDAKRPWRRPIRFGVHYATLPYPIVVGNQPHEFGASLGTGARFAQQRAGIDVALEHLWRSDGTGRKERAWQIVFGVNLRP